MSDEQTRDSGATGNRPEDPSPSSLNVRLRKMMGYVGRRFRPALKLEEYKIHIELYKFYLDFILKVNVFFFAIVGTILSVLYGPALREGKPLKLSTVLPRPVLEIFLLTPLYLSVIMFVAFLGGGLLWLRLTHHVNRALEKEPAKEPASDEFNMHVPVFTNVLTFAFFIFAAVFYVVAVFLDRIRMENEIPRLPF